MNVYVITKGWDYEGEQVIAVAATLALAKRVARDHVKTDPDGVTLGPWERIGSTTWNSVPRGRGFRPDFVTIERTSLVQS